MNPDLPQICQVCQINPHKYTCPRCAMHTCSVDCVKSHKQEHDCTGERDKTHFVARDKYNYSHMMSDYTYLEDVSRKSDTLTRERLKAPPSIDHRSKSVMKRARDMGIQYEVLPTGMSRHKANKTNYSNNNHQMFWTTECCFCRNGKTQKILEHSVPSLKTLRQFFENMFFADNPQGKGEYKAIRYQLRDFKNAGIERFVVALKKEGAPKNTFIDLTPHSDKTLRDILRGERVIEFPTLYIWLRDEVDDAIAMEEKVFVEHKPPRPRRNSKDSATVDNATNSAKSANDEQRNDEPSSIQGSVPDNDKQHVDEPVSTQESVIDTEEEQPASSTSEQAVTQVPESGFPEEQQVPSTENNNDMQPI